MRSENASDRDVRDRHHRYERAIVEMVKTIVHGPEFSGALATPAVVETRETSAADDYASIHAAQSLSTNESLRTRNV
jgi:hypothetical protein